MYLISACLCGVNCKYNGNNNYNQYVAELVKSGKAIPLCAEQLGGLSTPRIPSEIKCLDDKRKVFDKNGKDVTAEFEAGAREVLDFVKRMNIKKAILKGKSPSCGIGKIYDGTFNNKLVHGNGVLAQLLIDNGIEVINSDDFLE